MRKSKRAKSAKPAADRATGSDRDGNPSVSEETADARGLKIRMYRVGFGDFFLMTVPTAAGPKYVVIDCGVYRGRSGEGDLGSIEEAVQDLHRTTNGELALVIMTHRHADHIAGFSRVPLFESDFKASMVWMPRWELEYGREGSRKQRRNLLADVTEQAQRLTNRFAGRTDPRSRLALDQLRNATGFGISDSHTGKLRGNDAALDVLKNKLGDNGKRVGYYSAHDKPVMPPELEGVLHAEILGPPPPSEEMFLKLKDFKKGVGQYLDSMSDGEGCEAFRPFGDEWIAKPKKDYPPRLFRKKLQYRKIAEAVTLAKPDMFLMSAAALERFLNNQSLVILFEFAGKKLLFVGDAQAGNWEQWLYDVKTPTKDPKKLPSLTPESKRILDEIDFYKVGHHGSTNSTPIPVVEELANHKKDFIAMCSTEPRVYGNREKGTEVPRKPLMKAIAGESTLLRSDSVNLVLPDGGGHKPTRGIPVAKPKRGHLTTTNLYIEYAF